VSMGSNFEAGALDNLARLLDPAHWARVSPSLSRPGGESGATWELPRGRAEKAAAHLRSEGWFSLPGALSSRVSRRLRHGVRQLEAAGWLPIHLLMYEEVWKIIRHPALMDTLEQFLGGPVRQRSHAWVHSLAPRSGSHGWGPHVDAATRKAESLTLWIPLTPSTVENGCIYLIPRSPGGIRAERRLGQGCSALQFRKLMHRVRAVPARPGSLVAWRGDTVHWGSFVSEAAQKPRISIALEYELASGESSMSSPRARAPIRGPLAVRFRPSTTGFNSSPIKFSIITAGSKAAPPSPST
jgi:hypothetical protein